MAFEQLKYILLTAIVLFVIESGLSCSMYKITMGGKTMVGCNEDAWRLTPQIWYENGKGENIYGAAFTGSRFDGTNGYAPQSGMNDCGLSFSRLVSHTPDNTPAISENQKAITNPTKYLKDILHRCKNVEEVKYYIHQFDHSSFNEDVFIYIDRTGNYLVVEPYSMTIGHEPTYVLSNFCPSVTDESDALKLDRYRNGVTFLKNKTDTSIAFCTALSDTMHVCRNKIGDGTLLTSIWDLNSGDIHLYFYHQYNYFIRFNLQDELAKGDHILNIETFFPPNAEFAKLRDYKIPQNNYTVIIFLLISAGLFFFTSLFFLVSYFKGGKNDTYRFLKIGLCVLGLIMFYYMFVLCTNIYIFYFSAPYIDAHNLLISAASYIPCLILFLIVPLFLLNIKLFIEKIWGRFSKWLFMLNNLVYLTLIVVFAYWGLFNVFI